ncbi:glycosyltransferase family 2 protein [Shimia sp. R9_2]|uniref:glycosyltransferase family 2 protein n=1 Tax=Shimia sp. R9_2 TaxID=2821112 RepID=UPI001ADA94B4|nr:glycosyltransferase family 2 protein [Shimia sp. R9_2]MBO9397083.1 glycosyltransferase family 2 protein [Shimia sp. R9_2]
MAALCRIDNVTKLVLSLTTVPPRFPHVDKNLARLLEQTADIAEINLYVARKYRRFDYDAADLPVVPEGVNLRVIDEDLGPATKVLPAAREYAGQDVQILFCDDDKLYDNQWAQRYVDAAKAHPDCCIVEEAGHLDNPVYAHDGWQGSRGPRAQFLVKDWKYRAKRAATFGKWKPSKALSSGYVDILEGWGGVLVRPEFFDEACYDIPDVLWTVDDVWLSGCLERRGIPIWLNTDNKIRSKEPKNEGSDAALRKFVYMGHDRIAANRACIDYFRETYGIWGGTKA